jgi:cytoskeletal protein RodZ
VSIGETLARERQRAGLTITQVSLRTRIRETVIRGIERDDFSACGGNFYARGHIRSIGRVIGIDPEPLVQEFDAMHGGAPAPISAVTAFEPEHPVPFRERRAPNWSAAMALALALVVIYGVFQVFSGDSAHRTARQVAGSPELGVASPAPTRTQRAEDPVAVAPRKNVQLAVQARRNTWLSVQGDKGRELFSGTLRPGQSREWTAKKKISIIIGNSSGVRLTVNGKNLGTPDQNGGVVRLSFTPDDPDAA